MPERYRKLPVEIDAVQFTGPAENATPIIDWILSGGGTARWHGLDCSVMGHCPYEVEHLAIDTLEGTMYATPGDYVIRGVKGEFYPCKPDIFEATYEPASAAGSTDAEG